MSEKATAILPCASSPKRHREGIAVAFSDIAQNLIIASVFFNDINHRLIKEGSPTLSGTGTGLTPVRGFFKASLILPGEDRPEPVKSMTLIVFWLAV